MLIKQTKKNETKTVSQQYDTVIKILKKDGCRITSQRKLLIRVILEQNFASCKEIYYYAKKEDENVSLATVYRMIGMLENYGILEKITMYKVNV